MKKDLGSAIRKRRLELGMSQTQLGDLIGVDRGNVSRYEAGVNAPEIERLDKLAGALGLSLAELFKLAESATLSEEGTLLGSVPLISWERAAHGVAALDNKGQQHEMIETTYKAGRRTYALRVTSESMEPKFPQGCVIIVEPEEVATPGKYVVVQQPGAQPVLQQLIAEGGVRYLRPLNPRYPITELHPLAVFCGVVKRVEMDV